MRKIVELDAEHWHHVLDFYEAILAGVGAPEWHGQSINALVDSMIYGGINKVLPPYTVRVHNSRSMPDDLIDEVRAAKRSIAEARVEQRAATGIDVDIDFEMA